MLVRNPTARHPARTICKLATKACRTWALEVSSGRTRVVEFIELECAARILLIRAVRRPGRKVASGVGEPAIELSGLLGFEQPIVADLLRKQSSFVGFELHRLAFI